MKIKSDLERRTKEEAERAERAERYVHQRLAASIDDSFKRIISVPGEHVYIDHMVFHFLRITKRHTNRDLHFNAV
jgi:hypothetical protein